MAPDITERKRDAPLASKTLLYQRGRVGSAPPLPQGILAIKKGGQRCIGPDESDADPVGRCRATLPSTMCVRQPQGDFQCFSSIARSDHSQSRENLGIGVVIKHRGAYSTGHPS